MRVELLPRRQPSLPQEVGDLLEGRVGHQVVHVIAPVDEPALVAVDEADLRRRDDDVLETSLQGIDRGVRHGSLRFSAATTAIVMPQVNLCDAGGWLAPPLVIMAST